MITSLPLSLSLSLTLSLSLSHSHTHTHTHTHAHPHAPALGTYFNAPFNALYSSSYIIQIWIRDCQLADDPASKFNSSDENSLDSTLLWFSEFSVTRRPPNVTSCFIFWLPVLCRRWVNVITPVTSEVFSLWLVNSWGGLNQSASCFLWLCLPMCAHVSVQLRPPNTWSWLGMLSRCLRTPAATIHVDPRGKALIFSLKCSDNYRQI